MMTQQMKSQIFGVAMLALICLSQATETETQKEYDAEQHHHTELVCHECLDFTYQVNKIMHNNDTHTLRQLNKEFLEYCNGISKTELKRACLDYNNYYLPATATMVKNGIKDYRVCTYLGDCPMYVSNEEEHFDLGDACDTCQGLVELAGEFVAHKLSEDKVQTYLDSWCDHTHQYEEQCQEIVNGTLPLVYQYVGQHVTPQEICQLAHYC